MISLSIIKVFSGCGFGIKQPFFLLELKAINSLEIKFNAFDIFIKGVLREPTSKLTTEKLGLRSTIEKFVNFHLMIQERQKIPVFDKAKVISIQTIDSTKNIRAIIAVPYMNINASRLSLDWLAETFNLFSATPFNSIIMKNVEESFLLVEKKLMRFSTGNTNTIHFLRAAFKMLIPTKLLWPGCYGFGIASKMRRLDSSLTDETSAIAVGIAHSKSKTAMVLTKFGIPTPKHKLVQDIESAINYVEEIGYPIVVKPDNLEQGQGVSAGIKDQKLLIKALNQAKEFSENIIIEKHYHGQEYRLTVFRDHVLKVIQRFPCSIKGDGVHNIKELVDIEQNTTRYEKVFRQTGRMLIQLDDEALELLRERNYSSDSIPPLGDIIILRRKSNISAGGIQKLVPIDRIHPDNLSLAIRSCRAIGIDLCGVDLIMPDISKSWLEVGAVIIELNSRPQIGIDLEPLAYEKILLCMGNEGWLIPVKLVLCASNLPPPSCSELITLCGSADGISTSEGVWIFDKLVQNNIQNGYFASINLLINNLVTKAICCISIDDVIKFGLPISWFDSITLHPNCSPKEIENYKSGIIKKIMNGHTGTVYKNVK